MTEDTLTLVVDGDVTLSDFATTMDRFTKFISDLSTELAGDAAIEWFIQNLDAGSAIATVRAVSEDSAAVERVIVAYGVIGQAAESGSTIPYSVQVQDRVRELASIIDGRITSLSFETAAVQATITSGQLGDTPRRTKYSYGMLKGVVETLSSRRGFHFLIYDEVFDRKITCYVKDDQKETMRDAWGKRVAVSGRIAREPKRGLPIAIRDITSIRILPAAKPGAWRDAIGILPLAPNAERPEVILRRLRDG
jgi:hypothetical protein